MQTILPKASPPLTEIVAESKLGKQGSVDPKLSKPSPAPSVNANNLKAGGGGLKVEPMDVDPSPGNRDEVKMELTLDEHSIQSDSDSGDSAFKDSFIRACSAEEAFDKLKNEDAISIISSSSIGLGVDMKNASESVADVQKKIETIVDHFKKEVDDKVSDDMEAENLFAATETTSVVSESNQSSSKSTAAADDVMDQKENLVPASMDQVQGKMQKLTKKTLQPPKSNGPKLLYEIQSQDGFTYKSTSITDVWEKVFEAVQIARKAHGLSPLPLGPLGDMCGHQMLGMKTNALKYLLEQLPGVERCTNYKSTYHKRTASSISQASSSGYWSDYDDLKENAQGTARCERYKGRSEYDMFSWLASRHRKQPIQVCVPQCTENDAISRRGSGSNLPMAMRYRTLKETYKDSVGVYRSHIHGRGLFCNRDIEAGE